MFLHEIWPGRRAHYVNYENINNSNLDGMSLASFCQSRAVLYLYESLFITVEILLLDYLKNPIHNHLQISSVSLALSGIVQLSFSA